MSQNVIKIKTRKEDFKRIYQQDDLKHYIPRTAKSSQVFDWIVSLFAFGSNPKYYVEFTPHGDDSNWRMSKISNVTRCSLNDCPRYIRGRYLCEGYNYGSVFYCIEFEG